MSRTTQPLSPESSLVRAIGVRGLAAQVVNVTVGGGIFVVPAIVAAMIGPASPLAYLVCALAIGLVMICFAEAGSRVSLTGGPYAYVEIAFGPFIGFIAGVLLWTVGTMAMAGVGVIFAGSMGVLIPGMDTPLPRLLLLAVLFASLAGVNVRGVREGTRLVELVTLLKLLPLLGLVAVGVFFIEPSRIVIPSLPTASQLGTASVLIIFVFAGVESALVPSGEVREPSRTVPRALLIALLAITLIYLAIQVVAQGILGPALAQSTAAPLADAAERVLGHPGRLALLIGGVVSMFGYVSGMMLAFPRVLYAFARDGFLPARLAAVHPRFHTPHLAILLQGLIAFLLASMTTFATLAIRANVALLVLYLLCCGAAWQLRRRNVRDGGTAYAIPGAAAAPWAASLVIVFLLWSVAREQPRELLVALGIAGMASLLYLVARPRRWKIAADSP